MAPRQPARRRLRTTTGTARTAPAPHSHIHLRARERAVPRDRRAYLTVTVAPCRGRKGEPVRLRVGKQTVAKQNLSRTCKAHFRPKIDRRVHFRAAIAADATYAAATSDELALRPARGRSAKAGVKKQPLRVGPAVRDLDEGAPGGLRPEAGAGLEEADRVAEGARFGQVFPGEPVDLFEVEPGPVFAAGRRRRSSVLRPGPWTPCSKASMWKSFCEPQPISVM